MKTQEWNQIWSHRADNYAAALANYGNPLRNEFDMVQKLANLPSKPVKVIELMAGDGSLAAHIQSHHPYALVYATESSDEFAKHIPERITRVLTPDPLVVQQPELSGVFESVICYAAMHHTPLDQDQVLFNCAQQLLIPGGTFVYVDVFANQPTAQFLNDWVNTHSLYGHHGDFRLPKDVERCIPDPSAHLSQTQIWHNPTLSTLDGLWQFPSIPAMTGFIQQFFSLKPEISHRAILMALESMLGVETRENQVFLHWPLTSFVCFKANLDMISAPQKMVPALVPPYG